MCVAWVLLLPLAFLIQPAEKPAPKDSPTADYTRTTLLKVKVTADFKGVSLREALKELAAQVEMNAERPVLWTYPDDINPGQKVTYRCNEKPLETVLDELFTRLKLGYYVVSDEDNARDGWVRVTTGTERGRPGAAAVLAANEKAAAARLATAKEQIDKGKKATARVVLNSLIEAYPKTKAAAEAKALLEQLDK
jgi:hypothetical protein